MDLFLSPTFSFLPETENVISHLVIVGRFRVGMVFDDKKAFFKNASSSVQIVRIVR